MKQVPSSEFQALLDSKENLDFYLVLYLGENNHTFPERDVQGLPLDVDGYILSISDLTLFQRDQKEILNTADLGILDVRLIDVIDETALLFKNYKYGDIAEIRLHSAQLLDYTEYDPGSDSTITIQNSLPLISGTIMSPYEYLFAKQELRLTLETFSYDLADTMILNPDIGYPVDEEHWPVVLGDWPKNYKPIEVIDLSVPQIAIEIESDYDFPAAVTRGGQYSGWPKIIPINGNEDGALNGVHLLYLPVANHLSSVTHDRNFPTTMLCSCVLNGNQIEINSNSHWDLAPNETGFPIQGLHDQNYDHYAPTTNPTAAQGIANRFIHYDNVRTYHSSKHVCADWYQYDWTSAGALAWILQPYSVGTRIQSAYWYSWCYINWQNGEYNYRYYDGCPGPSETWKENGRDFTRESISRKYSITNYGEGSYRNLAVYLCMQRLNWGWQGTTWTDYNWTIAPDINQYYLDLYFIGGEPIIFQDAKANKLWIANRTPVETSTYEIYDQETLLPIAADWDILTIVDVDLIRATGNFDTSLEIFARHSVEDANGVDFNNPVAMMRTLMDNCTFEYDGTFGVPPLASSNTFVYDHCLPGSAYLESMNPVLADLERMAWEARCQLTLSDTNTLSIRFLPTNLPVEDMEIVADMIIHDSIKIEAKDIRELKTVFQLTDDNNIEYEFRNNDDLYGEFIYKDTVVMYRGFDELKVIIDYWGYILSNPWLRVTFNMRVNGAVLEVYDIVKLPFLNQLLNVTGDIFGKILKTSFNPLTRDVQLYVELPLLAESTSPDLKYWTGGNLTSTGSNITNIALATAGATVVSSDAGAQETINDGLLTGPIAARVHKITGWIEVRFTQEYLVRQVDFLVVDSLFSGYLQAFKVELITSGSPVILWDQSGMANWYHWTSSTGVLTTGIRISGKDHGEGPNFLYDYCREIEVYGLAP